MRSRVGETAGDMDPVDEGGMHLADRPVRMSTDDVRSVDEVDLLSALALAVRAPSVHNSQPWRWRLRPHGVDLYTDAIRRLPRTDPEGRDQVISCGAALHHLLVALADAGRGARVRRLPTRPAPPPRNGRTGPARRR
jgi:hypothetical protein